MTLPGSSKSDWQHRSEAQALAGGIGPSRVPESAREGHDPPLRAGLVAQLWGRVMPLPGSSKSDWQHRSEAPGLQQCCGTAPGSAPVGRGSCPRRAVANLPGSLLQTHAPSQTCHGYEITAAPPTCHPERAAKDLAQEGSDMGGGDRQPPCVATVYFTLRRSPICSIKIKSTPPS